MQLKLSKLYVSLFIGQLVVMKRKNEMVLYMRIRILQVQQLKVILETGALNEEQIRKRAHAVVAGGADWVKTSTGFLTGFDDKGADPKIVQILIDEVGDQIKVKGSGHIRTREHFLHLIDMVIQRMGVGYKSVPVVLGLEK